MHNKKAACFGVILSVFLAIGLMPRIGAATQPGEAAVSQSDTTIREIRIHSRFGEGKPFTDIGVHSTASPVEHTSRFPAVSIHQALKDQVAGLYIQETTGEPGAVQQMFLRGAPMPVFSMRDVYQSQPLVVLDGIPLIGEHPFAFDIQQYDFNRIGPATNLLSNIDMNNIASISVLKDLASTAIYGPMAANGVIVITTKQPTTTRKISFSSYVGMAQRPMVTTINGSYENAFRQQFYDRYTATGRYSSDDSYPLYLSDSLNASYYGPSNWTESYYQTGLLYSANA